MSETSILHDDRADDDVVQEDDKREQGTQSVIVEHNDILTEVGEGHHRPPERPPPLLLNEETSIVIESPVTMNSPTKDNTLKGKMKDVRNGTSKITKEMYSKMTKLFKISLSKNKGKDNVQSPATKTGTFSLDEEEKCNELKGANTLPLPHGPKNVASSPKPDHSNNELLKESPKTVSCITVNELITEKSIFSSFPIMAKIDDFLKENPDECDDIMDELFEHWRLTFVETCQRQIKNVIMTTNDQLSIYIDLNHSILVSPPESHVKVLTIPTWTQVRICFGPGSQKYIALKKSHSLSWFILPRECPKLNQRWVCYPIDSMNTLENELRSLKENSIQWMLLRMMVLKCFNKIYKSDITPIKLDTNNILLVSSSCGIIVVFKEGQQDIDVETFQILKSKTLADIPKEWSLVKVDICDRVRRFFCRLDIVSVLVTSVWPLDYMAYMLALLMMESSN